MAFLRPTISVEAGPVIFGPDFYLRIPTAGDYGQWAELRAKSRAFLVPWEPSWTRDELTRAAYRQRLRYYHRELREETGYAFFMFRNKDDCLLGGLTLSNVRRGVTQSCSLGYWTGQPYAGRGLMTQGVRAVIPFVFETLGLHRLEAACMLANQASIRVLEKNGFRLEGLARKYLKINGVWQDHLLYALLAEDWYA